MWRTIYFVLWQELLVLGWPYSILHSVCKTINVELNKSFFPGFEKSLSTRSKYEPPPDLMAHTLSRLFKPRKISFSSTSNPIQNPPIALDRLCLNMISKRVCLHKIKTPPQKSLQSRALFYHTLQIIFLIGCHHLSYEN